MMKRSGLIETIVKAWKRKDTAALRNLIADDYMAVDFEGKVEQQGKRNCDGQDG
jgi:predicted lipid-binding transport protein (Tim44 family)